MTTFETRQAHGELVIDGSETVDLTWFPVADLPANVNPFNRAVLARVGLRPR